MSTQFCKCGDGLNNLGVSSCPSVMKTIKKHMFTSLYNSDGTRNSIKLTDLDDGVLTDAYISEKIHSSDGSDKWYATPNVYENVESTRTDTTTEEFQSGLTVRIQNGVQTFMGNLIQVDESLSSRILSNGCSDFGVYEIDKDGSIRGEVSGDGSELFPIKINKGSLDSYSVPEVEGTSVQRIAVTFQYDGTVNELNLMKIENSNIEIDMLKIASNLDGTLSGTEGATQTETSLFVDFDITYGGSFGSKIPVQGKSSVDEWFAVDNDFTELTIDSVLELGKGIYNITVSGATTPTFIDLLYTPDLAGISALDQEVESNILNIPITA